MGYPKNFLYIKNIRMKNKILIFFVGVFCVHFLFSCKKEDNKTIVDTQVKTVEKTNTDTKVWAHFMLWYETPESTSDGSWGQHWKKGTLSPILENGEWKNLYTRYIPITGPYASFDPLILEYQLLLMKYAGIDGVIADWYGVSDMEQNKGGRDDKTRALGSLYNMCEQTGLELAVCYEDRYKTGTDQQRIDSIKKDIDYLQQNYFTKNIFSKINNQPLLLIFGPKVDGTNGLSPDSTLWNKCFVSINPKPAFYPLQGKSGNLIPKVAKSTYNWSNNSALSASDNYYLTQFNSLALINGTIFLAMPGFNDCYNGVNSSPTMRVTPHNGGAFFQQQLDLAKTNKVKYLQLVTWNDYGEGTIIEPTVPNIDQNGGNSYIYLEQLQNFTGVSSSYKEILPQIKRLYDFRIANKDNIENNKKLSMAFLYFRSLQPDKAIKILNELDLQ